MANEIEIEKYDPNKDYGDELKKQILAEIMATNSAKTVEDLKPIIIGLLLMQLVS